MQNGHRPRSTAVALAEAPGPAHDGRRPRRALDSRLPESLDEFEPLTLVAALLGSLDPQDVVSSGQSIEQMAWLVGVLSGISSQARALAGAVKQELLRAVADDEMLIARANLALARPCRPV